MDIYIYVIFTMNSSKQLVYFLSMSYIVTAAAADDQVYHDDVVMSAMASQIPSPTIVYSSVSLGAD